MAELLKLREADDPRDVIHRAVHRLVEGGLVILPTEAREVVAAHSLRPEAVEKLQALARSRESGAADGGELVLCVKGEEEARDYVLEPSPTIKRLMKRLWPGPLVLALPVPLDRGLHCQLPAATRQAVLRNVRGESAEVWFWVPAHEVVQSVMSLLPAPLVLWEDRQGAAEESPSPAVGGAVDLIIEDGPRQNRLFPTVIRVADKSWTLLEPGVVTESQLNRMTGKVILFVCTGNTCRSPLAEGIFRKLLADRLDCSPEELPERGYTIISAGLAATNGSPAAPESVEVARRYGVDLESHSSRPLTDDLLAQTDRVYTMTHSHRDSILFAQPDAADRVSLLSRDERDISDPIGCGQSEYEACGEEIARHLEKIVNEMEPRSK